MSFEGRYQKLCSCGNYEEQNVYIETKLCSICNKEWKKSNLVDDTNGESEGYDYNMEPKAFKCYYPTYETSIYDHISSNGRISKKLFEKIIIPKLNQLAETQSMLTEAFDILDKIGHDVTCMYKYNECSCIVGQIDNLKYKQTRSKK